MKHIFRFMIAFAILSAGHAAIAQGVLFPEPHPRMPFPRPLPGPHPLKVKSLRIDTAIQGQVATTRISQVFINDLDFVLDGTYFYPLPEDATFVEFATWDGDKKLRGEVLEREEARNRYLAIVRRCWDPGLLEYAGANLFQARVFPVPERGEKRIEFTYSQILKADHGLVSYVYPLQSGTQANPQPIGSATITVDVQSDQGLKSIYSPTHTIDVHRDGERRARLSYEAKDVLPDRNFQLFYSLSNADFGLSLLTHREGADDGYFMILFAPKVEQSSTAVASKDILFVLDTSGSMQERGKLDKALSALRFGVRSLNAGDRFNIVTFSTDSRKFRDRLIPASEEDKNAALQFIDRQSASGGTNIDEALKDAFASVESGDRPSYAVFVTDGLPTVGETDPGRILRDTSANNTRKTRLFTFGVGYDVNTFLLDQLAARNFGTADYVAPDEDLEVKLSNFFAKISAPVMTNLEVDWGSVRVFDVYPRQLPDLFRGSQLTIMGRYSGTGLVPLTLKGTVRGQQRTLKYEQNDFPSITNANDFLPRLWAMRKVGYLLEQIRISGENSEVKGEIIRLAKKYGFVTPYTSYLAADEKDLITGTPPMPRIAALQMSPASPGLAGVSNGAPVSAREAVTASVALRAMKTADVAVPQTTATSRRIGSKEFLLRDGTWTDTAYDPSGKLPITDLPFGSDVLLKTIAADKQLASYASLGRNVVVVHKGRVYRIHA
ncbi:MAG TPA: VIT and VWA domain-containing protein [Acidobacteriota bacterium]|nr:VIT and VWA domain-containing protein [Acidobacteriota bacterium]